MRLLEREVALRLRLSRLCEEIRSGRLDDADSLDCHFERDETEEARVLDCVQNGVFSHVLRAGAGALSERGLHVVLGIRLSVEYEVWDADRVAHLDLLAGRNFLRCLDPEVLIGIAFDHRTL